MAPQTLDEVEAALHRECRQLTIRQIRRLTGGMSRMVEAVIRTRGGFTRY